MNRPEEETYKDNTCLECRASQILEVISRQDFTDFNEGILTEYLDGNKELRKEVIKKIKYLFMF